MQNAPCWDKREQMPRMPGESQCRLHRRLAGAKGDRLDHHTPQVIEAKPIGSYEVKPMAAIRERTEEGFKRRELAFGRGEASRLLQ
jgi:hypothetical protein